VKRLFDIICVAVVGSVFGAGIGFLQGNAAFTGLPTEVRMGLSGWAAWTGCGVGLLFGLLLYASCVRERLSLRRLGYLLVITFFVGIGSAWLLGSTLGAGWVSCFITPTTAIGLQIIFSQSRQA